MHNPIRSAATMALGVCLGVVAVNANAIPIHSFSLQSASGTSTYTYTWALGDPVMESLTLSGWELDSNVWTSATMIYKNGGLGENGLGVVCNTTPSGNSCGQSEIGTIPWQMINIELDNITGYNSLTIGAASVNTDTSQSGRETAYLYGASCTPGNGCTPTLLDSYTYPGGAYPADTVSWTFPLTGLQGSGYTNLWLSPNAWGSTPDNNGNILLWAGPNGDAFSVSVVPEPPTIGMFIIGILIIGMLAGIRRRQI